MKNNNKNCITFTISGDNTGIMAALDEIEKKIDLITRKFENLNELSSRFLKGFREDFQENR